MTFSKDLPHRLWLSPDLEHDLSNDSLAHAIFLSHFNLGDILNQDLVCDVQPISHPQRSLPATFAPKSNWGWLIIRLLCRQNLPLLCSVVSLLDLPGDLSNVGLNFMDMTLILIDEFHDLGSELFSKASDESSKLKELLWGLIVATAKQSFLL